MTEKHSIAHALGGCRCERAEIQWCVICDLKLSHLHERRKHVDTCSKRCFTKLLRLQQRNIESEVRRVNA